jgi:hypothetical protein
VQVQAGAGAEGSAKLPKRGRGVQSAAQAAAGEDKQVARQKRSVQDELGAGAAGSNAKRRAISADVPVKEEEEIEEESTSSKDSEHANKEGEGRRSWLAQTFGKFMR